MSTSTLVMWDLEDCPIPEDLSGHPNLVYENIRIALRNEGYHEDLSLQAYVDKNNWTATKACYYSTYGISIMYFPENKDERVCRMLSDIFFWAMVRPTPSNVMLISSNISEDARFVLKFLKSRNFNVLLAHPSDGLTLPNVARTEWDLKTLLFKGLCERKPISGSEILEESGGQKQKRGEEVLESNHMRSYRCVSGGKKAAKDSDDSEAEYENKKQLHSKVEVYTYRSDYHGKKVVGDSDDSEAVYENRRRLKNESYQRGRKHSRDKDEDDNNHGRDRYRGGGEDGYSKHKMDRYRGRGREEENNDKGDEDRDRYRSRLETVKDDEEDYKHRRDRFRGDKEDRFRGDARRVRVKDDDDDDVERATREREYSNKDRSRYKYLQRGKKTKGRRE